MAGTRQVLFIQGGGAGVHDGWDNKLSDSLRRELGTGFEVPLSAHARRGRPELPSAGAQRSAARSRPWTTARSSSATRWAAQFSSTRLPSGHHNGSSA